jgi:hypothetical protein
MVMFGMVRCRSGADDELDDMASALDARGDLP